MKARERHPHLLNELIESELGAVETYQEVVRSAVGEPTSARNEFRRLEKDHRHSAEALARHLGLSDVPPVSPGQWKRFIIAMRDTFKVIDNPSMISALKEGEMRLVHQYDRALQEGSLDSDVVQLIESNLLPSAMARAQSINHFIAAQTGSRSPESST
jgi:hypothetical protein